MRILIAFTVFVIFLGFSLSDAGQTAAPPMPLKLPDDVSWVQTTLATKKDGTRVYLRHAFIADGNKWRLETEMFNKPTVIFIFDGKSLGSNYDFHKSKIPEEKSPQFWDPRTNVRMLYESFKKSHYKGIEKIENKNCWHFFDEEDGLKFNLWVDVVNMTPRRFFLEDADGSSSRDIYDDLSKEKKITPELFDPKNLNVILLGN